MYITYVEIFISVTSVIELCVQNALYEILRLVSKLLTKALD